MDNKERFDQLESLLVDMARKQDKQSDQISQIITELNRQGEAISRIERQLDHVTERLDHVTERLDIVAERLEDVIGVLKISAAAHKDSEQRQDAMLAEIREQGRRLDAQGQRQDAAVEALKKLFAMNQDTNQSQRQLLELTRLNTESVDDLTHRLPALEGQEPRIQRLEDEVFRKAS